MAPAATSASPRPGCSSAGLILFSIPGRQAAAGLAPLLATLWLGTAALAHAGNQPARLAVSLLQGDGAAIQLRLRVPDGFKPAVGAAGGPGSPRLVLAWPAPLALDRPLPDPATEDSGLLQAITLEPGERGTRLELKLKREVRIELRRVADSWVLRLEPEAPSAAPAVAGLDRPPATAWLPMPAPAATRLAQSGSAASAPPVPLAPAPAAARQPPSTPPPAAVRAPSAPAGPAVALPPAPAATVGAEPELLLLDVAVNGRALADVVRAEHWPGGTLLLPVEAWSEARLAPLARTRPMRDGTPAYALDEVSGATYAIDRQALSLAITVPTGALVGSTLVGAAPAAAPPPPRPQPGIVLNYDLSASFPGSGAPPSRGVVAEAIAFSAAGNLVTSGVVRDEGGRRSAQRLDSFWRYDMPERLQTLVVGDTVGTGGGWSRPARYGGVRWGRDFGMRPGFVTLPQPSLAGEAALPSTVDVVVNNARRLSQQVPPGPFALSNVPVVSGAGEIDLVVRDLLGNERIVRQRYYASPRLLAPGLTDFSLEGGRLRYGYGGDSFYRDGFGAATVRAGLTPALTGGARVELQGQRRAAGLELAGLLGTWGVAHLALAASRGSASDPGEQGRLLQLGIERNSPHGGGAFAYERASRGFAPFGELAATPAAAAQRARARLVASLGGPLANRLSGGISFVRQERWDGERIALLATSFSLPLWQRGSMSVSVNKRLDGDRAWQAAATVNLPLLLEDVNVAARVERDSEGSAALALGASHPPPAGPGLGWSAEASTRARQRGRAALQYNTDHLEATLEVAGAGSGGAAARAGARGSLGLLAGLPFASRPVGQGSFAVVEVEGMAGVPIKRSHQVVARTNARGMAFVPGLLPWQKNELEIDPTDLPLDAAVGDIVREVTPYAASGTTVRFTVQRSRQALVALQLADGKPVPLGARVRLPQGAEFVTGRRGEVWLTDLAPGRQRVEAAWPGGRCAVELPAQGVPGVPERIGPLTCARESQ